MFSIRFAKPTSVIAFLLILFSTFTMVSADAMEAGDPYLDAQLGLHYVVYQPSYSAHLPLLLHMLEPNCHSGVEESFAATYGSGKRFFTLAETSSQTTCAMNRMLIRGATRTVVNKPGSGKLTGTQIVFIGVGVSRSEMNKVVASLKAKYKA